MQKSLLTAIICCLTFTAFSQFTTANLSLPRADVAAGKTQDKVFFAGGFNNSGEEEFDTYRKRLDIYDPATDTWTEAIIPIARPNTRAVGVGTKIYIAGYSTDPTLPDMNVMDIYDTATDTWTSETFTMTNATGMTAIDNLIFLVKSGQVRIYNTTTGNFSSETLSSGRQLPNPFACNGKVLFAGGGSSVQGLSDVVDIYDIATGTFTTGNMANGRNQVQGVCADNKVYLISGLEDFSNWTTNIDVYDTETGEFSLQQMSRPKSGFGAAATDTKIYLNGGYDTSEFEFIDEVEVYDPATGETTFLNLSVARTRVGSVALDNKVYTAGGVSSSPVTFYSTVDIYTEGVSSTVNTLKPGLKVFPSPTQDLIFIENFTENFTTVDYVITDAAGKTMQRGVTDGSISVTDLPEGVYFLTLENTEFGVSRFVKL